MKQTDNILLGMTLSQLQGIALELSQPRYRGNQLAEWLYQKRATSFEEMSNLPKAFRDKLSESYIVGRSSFLTHQKSVDGTEKYLFSPLHAPDLTFETVYIPEEDNDRATLCVSSQVGCKMNCLFCATGKMGFLLNLSSADIINQVLSVPHSDKLTNIVFMGMGEPLDNYPVVATTLELLTSSYGLAWSPKRITVSTVGPKAGLQRFLTEQSAHLAISIHSPFAQERFSLMPVQKAFPIDQVLETLKGCDFSRQRRLSFEYIIFGGVNDSKRHADELIRLLRPLDCRVNLIRYHSIPSVTLPSSVESQVEWFNNYLNAHGIRCTIRKSRGEDVSAACGMLSTEHKAQ